MSGFRDARREPQDRARPPRGGNPAAILPREIVKTTKMPIRFPSAPGTMPSTPKAQRDDPIPPNTPGVRVLDGCASMLAGYHPSQKAV